MNIYLEGVADLIDSLIGIWLMLDRFVVEIGKK